MQANVSMQETAHLLSSLDALRSPVLQRAVTASEGKKPRRFSNIQANIDACLKSNGLVKCDGSSWVRSRHWGDAEAAAGHSLTRGRHRASPASAAASLFAPPEAVPAPEPRKTVKDRVADVIQKHRENPQLLESLSPKRGCISPVVLRNKSVPTRAEKFERLADSLDSHNQRVVQVVSKAMLMHEERLRFLEDNSLEMRHLRRTQQRQEQNARLSQANEWMHFLSVLRGVVALRMLASKVVVAQRGFHRLKSAAVAMQRFIRRMIQRRIISLLQTTRKTFVRFVQSWRIRRRNKSMKLLIQFLQDSAKCARFKSVVNKYSKAVRTCQRVTLRQLAVVRSQRRLLSVFWDSVDRQRVMAVATAKHKEIMDGLNKARKERVKSEAASASKHGKSGRRSPLKRVPTGTPLQHEVITVEAVAKLVEVVPDEIKMRLLSDDLRTRKQVFFSELLAYRRMVIETAEPREKAINKERILQQIKFDGPLEDFKFELPPHLALPPPPRFTVLTSPLHCRMLIRLGFHELKRVQLGWFRKEAEVSAIVTEELAEHDSALLGQA